MKNSRFLDYDSIFSLKKLYVFGSTFVDILKLIDSINQVTPTWELCGFIGNSQKDLNIPAGYSIITEHEMINILKNNKDVYIVNNSNLNNSDLKSAFNRLLSYGCKLCNLIHPDVDINRVKIGNGCIIPNGSIIGGNSVIGNCVIFDYKVLISHDVIVEDNVLIGLGACIGGKAHLKRGSIIGMGSIVMGHLTVNEGSLVGAGAVVTKDVQSNTVVIGVPAKPIKRHIHG